MHTETAGAPNPDTDPVSQALEQLVEVKACIRGALRPGGVLNPRKKAAPAPVDLAPKYPGAIDV